jgi:hypothetical protein
VDPIDTYELKKTWYKTVSDSSIEWDNDDYDFDIDNGDEPESLELNVLTSMDKLQNDCNAIGRALSNAHVNDSCGFHVHLDMRKSTNRDAELVYHNLVVCYRSFLEYMLPESRRDNSYCQPNSTVDLERQKEENDRYKAINVEILSKFNTIEVRAHSGTVNPTKIYNWCLLLNKIADCKLFISSRDSRADIYKKLGVDGDLLNYINERLNKFE